MRREWACNGHCTDECVSLARSHEGQVDRQAEAAIKAQRRTRRAEASRGNGRMGGLTPISAVVAPALWLRSVAGDQP